MTDFYLKAATEADMNAALLAAGMIDEEGLPTEGVLLDVIGPIVEWDYSVEPPLEIDYPEWHVNIRYMFELTEEQEAELAGVVIVPPALPYRVWA